jgi:flagellar basal-body rod protein FlgB
MQPILAVARFSLITLQDFATGVFNVVSKLDNALSFQHQALSLRANRQQVLAANIANADTPNYKARDIDFAAALKNAVAGRGNGALEMARSSGRHLGGSGDVGPSTLLYRKEVQASADGNTVNMDVERSQFAENAIQYEAGVAFITHQLRMMTAAIQTGQ